MTARLSELTTSARRLALVGLAKNTGKTVTLGTLLRELEAEGRRVGVTSVGRDGEERDVIDARIEKPRIELPGGSLVATTDSLLRASGIPHDLLEQTDVRTPLGRVLVARLRGAGAIEVAGPSGAEQVRAVSDAMLAHGAEQVLIDGAIDRRAASSPDVSEGLVLSTGAVLATRLEEVVAQTAEAVELFRLPQALHSSAALSLPRQLPLTASPEQVFHLLDANPSVQALRVWGALPELFLDVVAQAAHRRKRELAVIVTDTTKIFIAGHSPAWYGQHGIRLEVLHPTALQAITVNPVAPGSHSFDSRMLRSQVEEAIEGVHVLDVAHSDYIEDHPGTSGLSEQPLKGHTRSTTQ